MRTQKIFKALFAAMVLLSAGAGQRIYATSFSGKMQPRYDRAIAAMPGWATRIVKWFNPTDEQCAVLRQAACACGNLLAKGAVKFSHPELSASEQATLLSFVERCASVLEYLDMAETVTSPMAKLAFLRAAVTAPDLFEVGCGREPLVFAMVKGDPLIKIPRYPWKAYRVMVVLLALLEQAANDLHCLRLALSEMNNFVTRVNEFDSVSAFSLWPEVLLYGFDGVDLGRKHTLLPSRAKTALLSCNAGLRFQGLSCFQLMLKNSVGVDAAIEVLTAMDPSDTYRLSLENSLLDVVRSALAMNEQSQLWAVDTLVKMLNADCMTNLRDAKVIFNSLPTLVDSFAHYRLSSAIQSAMERQPWYKRMLAD